MVYGLEKIEKVQFAITFRMNNDNKVNIVNIPIKCKLFKNVWLCGTY